MKRGFSLVASLEPPSSIGSGETSDVDGRGGRLFCDSRRVFSREGLRVIFMIKRENAQNKG
jgi:hypothetical protein